MSDWTDQDKTALLALVTRFVRKYDERKQNGATIEQLTERNVTLSSDIAKLAGAFSVFGVSTKGDGWGKPIKEAVGDEAWNDAMEAAGRLVDRSKSSEIVEEQLASASEAEKPSADGTVRELVLERLNSAGEAGTSATVIREYIDKLRGSKLHYKTVGMTLYRLSQDGLARREGRTWFFVPPVAETKNPAGETAGS